MGFQTMSELWIKPECKKQKDIIFVQNRLRYNQKSLNTEWLKKLWGFAKTALHYILPAEQKFYKLANA